MEFTTTSDPVTRGALAKQSGCNAETIRYYEKIGLLPPPRRSAGGHRLYMTDDQRRLRFILRARELGFGIEEIRSLLSMSDRADYSCGEIHDLTVAHLASVRQKITDLVRLEQTLSGIAQSCQGGDRPDCPVIDALRDG